MPPQVVGTAYVRLRLLTDTVGKDIERSIKNSDLQNIDIKVDADTLAADAELEETKRQAEDLDGRKPKITPKVDSKDAKKQSSLLLDALLLLGPAIGPLAGAAAAGFGAVVAGAGVAVLAVKGVEKEIEDGTTAGVQFSSGVQTMKRDLSVLQSTAARGVLPGFTTTVSALNTALPGVNRSVGILSQALGDLAGHTVVGLVAGLTTFEPLLTHITQEADAAARQFQSWATGPGGSQFAVTLGRDFDQVVPVLVDLSVAVIGLLHDLAPLGGTVLGIVDGVAKLASAIESLPLPVVQAFGAALLTWRLAARLTPLFEGLGGALTKLGGSAAAAKVGLDGAASSIGTIVSKGAGIAALGVAAYQAGTSFARWVFGDSGIINSGKAFSGFYNAVVLSNGAIDDGVQSAVQYQIQQDGLVEKAGKAGISQDQLTAAITGTQAQVDALTATWKANGAPSAKTIKNLQILHDTFVNAYGPAADFAFQQKYAATLQPKVWGALRTTKDSVNQVATEYGISADSVANYASLVGISQAAIKNGDVTNRQLAASVKTVSDAYMTATATGSQFLAAVATFSTSAGTAADRAALIGATLKAANGDNLSYAASLNSAVAANHNLITSLQQAGSQVGKSGESVGAYVRSIVNLKTGTIDYTNAAAGPLIQGLQQIQDAAMQAASAQFQHERATKGAGVAADSAYTTYVKQTRGSLIDEASQLGLTKDQAKKLADAYFGMPKDVKTKIEQEGADPVVTVLNSIKTILGDIAKAWGITVDADTSQANAAITALVNRVNSINLRIPVGAGANAPGGGYYGATGGLIGLHGIQRMAGGGPAGLVKGPGTGTNDKAGLFALSDREFVSTAASADRNMAALVAGNHGATLAVAGSSKPGKISGGGSSSPLHMVQSSLPRHPTHVSTLDLRTYLASVVSSIGHLAVAYSDRPVVLVAKDGTGLAKVVNDANLRNNRRM